MGRDRNNNSGAVMPGWVTLHSVAMPALWIRSPIVNPADDRAGLNRRLGHRSPPGPQAIG